MEESFKISSTVIITGAFTLIGSLCSTILILFLRGVKQELAVLSKSIVAHQENTDLKFKNVENSIKASDTLNASISSNNKNNIEELAKDQADLILEYRSLDRDTREEIRSCHKKMDEDFSHVHKRVDSIQSDYVNRDDLREHKKEVFFAIKTPPPSLT